MATIFNTPGKGISEYIAISDDTCKEGIWYLQWESEEIAKEQKKYLVGVGLNYYIKNSKDEYKMIDKCGGIIPFDGGAFVDIRKPQTTGTVYMALNVLVTEDYDLEHFNFNVAFELSSFTGGEEKSIYTEGCIDGSLADDTCTKYKIAEGATHIRVNTFRGLTSISEIKVPESVTTLDTMTVENSEIVGPFDGCSGLTKVEKLTNITLIPPRAFRGCTSLSNLNVEGADIVYASAFIGSTASSTLEFDTLTIKNGAFVVGLYDGVGFNNKHIFATIEGSNLTGTNNGVHKYYLSYVDSSYNSIKIFVDNKTTADLTLSSSKTSGTLNNVTFVLGSKTTTFGTSYGVTVTWT